MLFYVVTNQSQPGYLQILSELPENLDFLPNISLTNNTLISFINDNISTNNILVSISANSYDGLTTNNFILEPFSTLDIEKQQYMKEALNVLKKTFGIDSFFNGIKFNVILLQLMNNNIFVTKDTLNSIDTKILSQENKTFLASQFSELDSVEVILQAYEEFVSNLQLATTTTDIQKIFTTFISMAGVSK